MTKVIHVVENTITEKDIENPCFILANKIGGYASFSNWPVSRYQGVFFNDGKMFKVIENITPLDSGDVAEVKNRFWCVERQRRKEGSLVVEKFFMPLRKDCIVYELSEEKDIEIDLDAKESYDNREFGRYYNIKESKERSAKDKIIIEYTKKTDKIEDAADGQTEYKVYVVIGGRFDRKNLRNINEFARVEYPFDRNRGSMPHHRYIYKALSIRSKMLVITFSRDEKKAIQENNLVMKHLAGLKEKQEVYVNGFSKSIKDNNINMAYKAACVSLDHLVNNIPGNKRGIYAGLWWFFQYWARDELVSLKALMLQQKYALVKEILFRHIKMIDEDGNLPNRDPPSPLPSADAVGWLFKRVYDFIEILYQKKIINEYLSEKELLFIKAQLENSVFNLLKKHTANDYAVNGRSETWMDTHQGDDFREGARIEIQALRLNMYKLMKLLCRTLHDDIGYNMADHLENDLLKKVRENFWNGSYLNDGLNDRTIRPNAFIAYYAYPDLLSQKQWIACFREILKRTWDSWGGLSTIDKGHPLYCGRYTGEDNRSYHRGDSWYWINDLTALCLAKVSRPKFSDYIDKITKASAHEILWMGAISHHTELSSSEAQESNGCLMQAWSAAMFIELVNEIF